MCCQFGDKGNLNFRYLQMFRLKSALQPFFFSFGDANQSNCLICLFHLCHTLRMYAAVRCNSCHAFVMYSTDRCDPCCTRGMDSIIRYSPCGVSYMYSVDQYGSFCAHGMYSTDQCNPCLSVSLGSEFFFLADNNKILARDQYSGHGLMCIICVVFTSRR